MQEPGESYEHYRMALLKIAEGCGFQSITPDKILRDRLLFGIKDQQAREKLLRKADLTLADTDDIIHSHETTESQHRLVDERPGTVHIIDQDKEGPKSKSPPSTTEFRECLFCERRYDFSRRELYVLKTCN